MVSEEKRKEQAEEAWKLMIICKSAS